jgi:hypothetical protein
MTCLSYGYNTDSIHTRDKCEHESNANMSELRPKVKCGCRSNLRHWTSSVQRSRVCPVLMGIRYLLLRHFHELLQYFRVLLSLNPSLIHCKVAVVQATLAATKRWLSQAL